MLDFIPTAQEQLKFLKNIQLILQSGSFSSTYKFALLISLSGLAIEKGEDSGESLSLEYRISLRSLSSCIGSKQYPIPLMMKAS